MNPPASVHLHHCYYPGWKIGVGKCSQWRQWRLMERDASRGITLLRAPLPQCVWWWLDHFRWRLLSVWLLSWGCWFWWLGKCLRWQLVESALRRQNSWRGIGQDSMWICQQSHGSDQIDPPLGTSIQWSSPSNECISLKEPLEYWTRRKTDPRMMAWTPMSATGAPATASWRMCHQVWNEDADCFARASPRWLHAPIVLFAIRRRGSPVFGRRLHVLAAQDP